MISCSKIDFHYKTLNFEAFPNSPLPFEVDASKKTARDFQFQVVDKCSRKVFTLFVSGVELQKLGLSLSTWKKLEPKSDRLPHFIQISAIVNNYLKRAAPVASKLLSSQFAKFFTEQLSFATRTVVLGMYARTVRISKVKNIPGIYFHKSDTSTKIFINLKRTPALGKGSFGKVRLVLWLSAPDKKNLLVAKKVAVDDEESSASFQNELKTLQSFSNKRGIISFIAGGKYRDKKALFLPLYQTDMYNYFRRPFPLTLDQKVNISAQLIEGLATISEKGVHGDLSAGNLLLRNIECDEIEAVISDFGTFRPHGLEESGLTTVSVGSPEYFLEHLVTSKHDVWSLGISLAQLYANTILPVWNCDERHMYKWSLKLTPSWVLKHLGNLPPFLSDVINQMLDPRHDKRPSAKKVLEDFSSGLIVWQQERTLPTPIKKPSSRS